MSLPIIEPPDLTEAFPFVISHSEVDQLFVAKGGNSMATLSASIHLNLLHISFDVCMETKAFCNVTLRSDHNMFQIFNSSKFFVRPSEFFEC
jgi:hypothetical protein